MKLRICFLLRSLDYGGVERQLVTLAKTLARRNYNVAVICFYPGGGLTPELEDSGVSLICLGKLGRWDVFGFFRRLIRCLKTLQPDVLHAYLGVPNLMTIFLKPFFPATKMVWGLGASYIDWRRYDWFIYLTFQLERLFSRCADLIIVNSFAGRSYHLRYRFPHHKMLVIQNGFDTEKFCPAPAAGAGVRAEWGIPEDAVLIGLVGRLDPMKDHPTFLKAAAILQQMLPDARFVCVGSGTESYSRTLAYLAAELKLTDKVVWTGARSDMNAVYNALSVACSSSSGEGLPNVIGEAMACGVPCVVTDVGDSARLVGDTGVIVSPGNPEALARGWMQCLQEDRQELGAEARARVIQNFGVQRLADETEKAIRLLVAS
jgi:glycosyltransferase involved in cell wall biosynthesis